jgi:hypothetical protein
VGISTKPPGLTEKSSAERRLSPEQASEAAKTMRKIFLDIGENLFLWYNRMLILDEVTIRILDAKAMATHQTPSELVAALVRKRFDYCPTVNRAKTENN